MTRRSSITAIFWEFFTRYPRHFLALFGILVFQGLFAMGAVLAIVPLADYLLDPSLESPSRLTATFLQLLERFGIGPSFWLFGLLFVAGNLIRSLLEIVIRYAVFRIKYDVMRGLFTDTLRTFFKARWERSNWVPLRPTLSTCLRNWRSAAPPFVQIVLCGVSCPD